ncbi:dCTP deaminase domain-containing protein [Pseudomonas huaxiensis]|uniref:dCTP deaminase domain-containing protein n=1 Tax=Pseudomonas huaxiensis TaxID=2213017 RepID=UPI000DA6A92E|nr:deoxycytidine triphosphate deaminase [Pseudomonas huaxiensis]
MFWSGKTLEEIKDSLIVPSEGDSDKIKIDCAAISLTLGNEIYVTPNTDKEPPVKQILERKKPQFIIPKGQFALLTTSETVIVPHYALAFISFKAKYKFKGLINVSGFHVDPGWKGQLTFSVYNAGPTDILMERGKPFALIWYADLDNKASKFEPYAKEINTAHTGLDHEKVAAMTGEVFSPFKLKSEIETLKKEMVMLESKILTRYSLVFFAIFTAIMTAAFRNHIAEWLKALANALKTTAI